MCVYAYICMYVCMYVCMLFMYVCACVCVCVFICTYMLLGYVWFYNVSLVIIIILHCRLQYSSRNKRCKK